MSQGDYASSFLGSIAKLTAGAVTSRALGAVAQLLLAVWLLPQDFGAWATASAVAALVIGIRNVGQVSGYLSMEGSKLSEYLPSAQLANLVLTCLIVVMGLTFAVHGRQNVFLLLALMAVSLPFHAQSDFHYAELVRMGRPSRVYFGQSVGAVVRLIVGAVVAWATKSPLAFGLSYLAAHLATSYTYAQGIPALWVPRLPSRRRRLASAPISATWTAHSFVMTANSQIDYLVLSVLARPQLLGIYFLSYQSSVGLTAMAAVPVGRVLLAGLSSRPSVESRTRLTRETTRWTVGVSIGGVAVGAAILPSFRGSVSPQWETALPAISVLLGSVPARLLTPVADAALQAEQMWGSSIRLHLADLVGTGLAASVALTGDVVVTAAAVSVWKSAYALFRCGRASKLLTSSVTGLVPPVGMVATMGCCIVLSVSGLLGLYLDYWFAAGALLLALLAVATWPMGQGSARGDA